MGLFLRFEIVYPSYVLIIENGASKGILCYCFGHKKILWLSENINPLTYKGHQCPIL